MTLVGCQGRKGRLRIAAACMAFAAVACSPQLVPTPSGGGAGGADGGGDAFDPSFNLGGSSGSGGWSTDAGTQAAGEAVVYAHTASELYRVDPDSLKISLVGKFVDPHGTVYLVTDIAVDRMGQIIGVTFRELLAIDSKTAAATLLAELPNRQFNGLSWVRVDPDREILVGTSHDGTVWQINPQTAHATQIGEMGANLRSSGDLVSIDLLGTLATAVGALDGDSLVRLDPATGKATVIGPTGFGEVWGLGYWKDRVYGFTSQGNFILIDPRTGSSTLIEHANVKWYGAGVTTSAPVTLIP